MRFVYSVKKLLIKISEYLRCKKSYSQDGEDVVLHSFFEGKKHYKGIYVDIGAHHPYRFSNTCFYYKKGWKGINIDPTPGSMIPFKIFRQRDINLELGIGKVPGELTFYCFSDPALNTFDVKLAEERNVAPYYITRTIRVKVEPLGEILKRFLEKGIKIDFFTIDVEGFDFEVLQSNDWDNYSPDYILIEDNNFKIHELRNSDIYNFLYKKGYGIIAVLKRTIIYTRLNL